MTMTAFRMGVVALSLGSILALAGCTRPLEPSDDLITMTGTLDRNGLEEEDSAAVAIEYDSHGALAEWWPCDLRLTGVECVGSHHVNVYITLPNVGYEDLGTGHCAVGDAYQGIFQKIAENKGGSYTLGNEVRVYVIVGSDVSDDPIIDLADDAETTAASHLVSGTLDITHYGGQDSLSLEITGQTTEGREIQISFGGPAHVPPQVPGPEGPTTCAADA